jgi:hypothetical protein
VWFCCSEGDEEDLTCPRLLPEGEAEKAVVGGGGKKRRASKDDRYAKTKNKRKRQRDLYKGTCQFSHYTNQHSPIKY